MIGVTQESGVDSKLTVWQQELGNVRATMVRLNCAERNYGYNEGRAARLERLQAEANRLSTLVATGARS